MDGPRVEPKLVECPARDARESHTRRKASVAVSPFGSGWLGLGDSPGGGQHVSLCRHGAWADTRRPDRAHLTSLPRVPWWYGIAFQDPGRDHVIPLLATLRTPHVGGTVNKLHCLGCARLHRMARVSEPRWRSIISSKRVWVCTVRVCTTLR